MTAPKKPLSDEQRRVVAFGVILFFIGASVAVGLKTWEPLAVGGLAFLMTVIVAGLAY